VPPPGQQQVTPPPSQRELLSQALGIDLRQFADDQSALQALRNEYQRRGQIEQQYQQFVPHLTDYQKWQQSQQQQQRQAAAEKAKWWNPPQWDERWLQQVEADPQTGQLRALPNADPSIPQKIAEYRRYQSDMLHKLTANPVEMMKPGLQELIDAQVKSALEARFGQHDQQQFAHQQIERNAEWLYAKTADGKQYVMGPDNKRQMSAAGQVMMHFVKKVEQEYGVADVRKGWELAESLTRAYLMDQAAKHQQVPAPGGPPAAVIPQPGQQPPVGGGVNRLSQINQAALEGAGGAGKGKSLKSMLREAFEQNGVTDADFATTR